MNGKIEKPDMRYTDKDSLTDAKDNMERLIVSGVLEGKYVVLFGANGYAEHLMSMLDKKGWKVSCIIDNQKEKIGCELNGIPIRHPNDIVPYRKNALILIASAYYEEMAEQLQKLGFDRNEQVVRLVSVERDTTMLTMNALKEVNKSLMEISRLIELERQLCPKGEIWFLMPVFGLGDYYYLFGYLKSYCSIHEIKNCKIMVLSCAGAVIGKMYGYENTKVIDAHQMKKLIRYADVMGEEESGIAVLHWACRKCEPIAQIHKNSELYEVPFNKTYEMISFGEEMEFTPLSLANDKDKAKGYFSVENMKKGRTVVLAPDSNTIVSIPRSFWRGLAIRFKKENFCVCTNLAKGDESPIEGTEGVYVPLEDFVDFCDASGYFVGSRSGICDLICMSKCKKAIVYNKSFRLNNVEKVFSFKRMNIGRNINEFHYEDEIPEILIEKVVDFIIG